MAASQLRKKITSSLFLALLLSAIVLIITFVVKALTPDTFWQNYLSNTGVTMVGILVGLPLTLLITDLQQTLVEIDRREKVLSLLYEELEYDLRIITTWISVPHPDITSAIQLHLELRSGEWGIMF